MISLSQTQIEVLKQITDSGNYWEGYTYLISILQPESGAEDYLYWLGKAAEINSNSADSTANTFIREVTRAGIIYDVTSPNEINIQQNSQFIGDTAIGEIIETGFLTNIAYMIGVDVQKEV